MTEEAFLRLIEDLAKVPLIREVDIERYQDGRWLYEPACAHCGAPLDERWHDCLTCRNRHEKRRQRLIRGQRPPAPLFKVAA